VASPGFWSSGHNHKYCKNLLSVNSYFLQCCKTFYQWIMRWSKSEGNSRMLALEGLVKRKCQQRPNQKCNGKYNLGEFYVAFYALYTSDGQIQIAIRFKSRLNHLWRFDLSSKRFDLNVHDSIGIRFEIDGDSIWKSDKLLFAKQYFLKFQAWINS